MLLLVALGLGATAVPASADPVAITEAPPLKWGFKQSWRVYTGQPTVSSGATVLPDSSTAGYDVGWRFASGSYDAATRTTVLRYEGSVRWKKYFSPDNPQLGSPPAGYDGPLDVYLLDTTVTDPVITISRDTATISADAQSRQLETWRVKDFGRVDILNLALDGAAPTIADGTTTWSGLRATTNAASTEVFGGNYQPGAVLDPVGFSYSGPGGAPDLSESFDAPGTIKLALDRNVLTVPPLSPSAHQTWAVDPVHRLAHYRVKSTEGGQSQWTYQAFDLDTMQPLGSPLVLPQAQDLGTLILNDTTSGRLYTRNAAQPDVRAWIRYDRTAGAYVRGSLDSPIPTANISTELRWDPIGQRAFEVERTVPSGVGASDYDQHVWLLKTYAPAPDGTSWTQKRYVLPSFPLNLNRRGYGSTGVAASDGSLVLLGAIQTKFPANSAVTAPATVPGAYRIVTRPDGTADVAPIPGTGLPNVSAEMFDVAPLAGPDGEVLLGRQAIGTVVAARVQQVDVTPASGPIAARPLLDLGIFDGVPFGAADPEDASFWFGGQKSQRIVGIRDGRIVSDQFFRERHERGGPLVGGPGHLLYAQSGDATPGDLVNYAYGYARFTRTGISPTVTGDPQDRQVTLTADQPSETVSFSSAASADPAPTRQWQVKLPGGSRFVDVAGESGETLTVAADRTAGGRQYRAVYANAAGRNASATATLGVDYAPRVTFDPLDASVREGQPATFEVLANGHPDPAVVWQRRVGGFWQTIASDDENFRIDGNRLVVPDTNVEQSGSAFRARLENEIATTYSKVATLTVTPERSDAQTLVGVELDWTGSDELQRMAPNRTPSFFSAGPSDGSEAAYRASAPGVRIAQVSADGSERAATWATRGAHTSGGGHQLVRLTGGRGTIAVDGSTTIDWTGAFSVNVYGGLVPFTVTAPRLTIDPSGRGTLTGDLSGYGASQTNPNDRHPLTPVPGVVIARFSGAKVDPSGTVTIAPDYAGVSVDVPAGAAAQDRSTAGWGAWPQPFVSFQGETGLASYWYSSGGAADPHKSPEPFAVRVTGRTDPDPELPGPSPLDPPTLVPPSVAPPVTPPAVAPKPAATTKPKGVPAIAKPRGVRRVDRTGRVTLATVSCRTGPCRLTGSRIAIVRIGARAFAARISGTTRIANGRKATLRVKLPAAARRALRGRRGTLTASITLRSPGRVVADSVRLTIR